MTGPDDIERDPDSDMSIEDVARISSVTKDDDDDAHNVFVIDDSWDDENRRGGDSED